MKKLFQVIFHVFYKRIGGNTIKFQQKTILSIILVLTALSMMGTSSAASYTVDNSSYLNIFTANGIADEFSLDGVDHTFEDHSE